MPFGRTSWRATHGWLPWHRQNIEVALGNHIATREWPALRVGAAVESKDLVAYFGKQVEQCMTLTSGQLVKNFCPDDRPYFTENRRDRFEDLPVVAFGVDLEVTQLWQPGGKLTL